MVWSEGWLAYGISGLWHTFRYVSKLARCLTMTAQDTVNGSWFIWSTTWFGLTLSTMVDMWYLWEFMFIPLKVLWNSTKTSGPLSCVGLTVTMVMPYHFLTQLLIILPLSCSRTSNCVLLSSHELPILDYTVKISTLKIYEKKCSRHLPITLSKSLQISLLQIFLPTVTLVSYWPL